jgi:hypothetical protein
MASRRVERVRRHLTAPGPAGEQGAQQGAGAAACAAAPGLGLESAEDIWSSGDKLEGLFASLPNELPRAGEYDLRTVLPGPLSDAERFPRGWLDAFADLNQSLKRGHVHLKFAEWQRRYGAGSLASNIIVPYLIFKRSNGDEGVRAPPVVTYEVVVGNPEDARRLGRVHVKKQPNFNLFFFGSVISTVDTEYWRMQREQLVPGFLPEASLKQIFDISSARAVACSERLRAQAALSGVVDLNEFLLYEAQAQLQLALFGETQEFMDETNEKFRGAMSGSYDPGYVRPFCKALADRMERDDRTGPALAEDVAAGRCPAARGPLSAMLRTMEGVAPRTREGNVLITAFAGHGESPQLCLLLCFFALFARHRLGREEEPFKRTNTRPLPLLVPNRDHHDVARCRCRCRCRCRSLPPPDTTGHTMSWLLFELSRHPEIQRRLQAEVDTFFATVGERRVVYEDLKQLRFMTRCIMETLRLWPAVANGTFRELQFDDWVMGPDGNEVRLPKGTYVRIVNWSRHRNPELWGPDVDTFNPDRDFRDEEIFFGDGLRAYNPATDRFSPFTFPPRGCIGMNFSQLEMRLIVASLLKDFSFELVPEFEAKLAALGDPALMTVNYGTMAPRDLLQPEFVTGFAGWAPQVKVPNGLPLRVVARAN